MARTVLNVARLRVERGDTVILHDLSWRVRRGEHWLIIGPNGSGKTSLLSAITGYLTPTAGIIEVLGQRYGETDWRELRKRVGLVSSTIRQMMHDDEPALETVISGKYAMIDFWGEASDADRKRGLEILRKIECEQLARRPWQVLSQGERQRALIGRALMSRAPLLLLDEPCAGLDPVAREHFLQFLQRLALKKGSPTIVLVTHHVEEIIPAFTHLLLLREGRAVASGNINRTLTAQRLSETFDHNVELIQANGRFRLAVGGDARRIM